MATSSSFTSASYYFTLYKTALDDLVDHFRAEATNLVGVKMADLFESFGKRGQRLALLACVDAIKAGLSIGELKSGNSVEDGKLCIFFSFAIDGAFDNLVEILEEQAERPLAPAEKSFIQDALRSFSV